MIRLIIVVLLLLIFAVFSLIALPILWLIGKKNPVVKEKASDAIARFMFRLILFVCGTKTTAYVAKKEMAKVPILRVWMRNIRCLLLDRQNTREALKSILSGIEYIKDGTSLVIFPEGTRNKGEGVMEFHAGSFKLAEKSHSLIIPVTQNNTSAIFEDQKPFLKKAHTVIEFGTPVDMSLMSPDEKKNVAAYIHDIILSTYEKNQNLV